MHSTTATPCLGRKTQSIQHTPGTTTQTEEIGRGLQPPQSLLSLGDLCTAFSTLLQPGGAANSTWKELEVAMKILVMFKEPLGAAGWKEKQRQGSSEGSILETPKEEDMGFMMGKIQGCLQSCWAKDGLQTCAEHVRLQQRLPSCGEKQSLIRGMGRREAILSTSRYSLLW